jgi:hypothetical protein
MKSFLTGYGTTPDTQTNAAALRSESFARSLHNLSYAYKAIDSPLEFEKVWKEVGNYLDSMEKYSPESAVMFLQLFKGYSRNEAIEKIDMWMNSQKEDQ